MSSTEFSTPSNEAIEHSLHLVAYIRDQIKQAGGVVTFDQYMDAVLYTPGLGYYSAGSDKIGPQGDFITAPEISPFFSQCVAQYCHTSFTNLEQPSILELGAGLGTMAADILSHLEQVDALPEHYLILETSPDLQQRQQQTIGQKCPNLLNKVSWLSSLPTRPIKGVILGNEIIDAMPCKRFRIDDKTIIELGVTNKDGRFQWQDMPQASDGLLSAVEKIQVSTGQLPEGYCSEINLHIIPWLNSLADILAQGNMLWIDYGYLEKEYYHAQRKQGTLRCYYQHRAHDDPFAYPGLQDITAHVNFSALIDAARELDLTIDNYQTQANFLFSNQLERLFNQAIAQHPDRLQTYAQQIKTLTLPQNMGESFKVVSLIR